MTIYLGSDHGGFALKDRLVAELRPEGYEITDCGTYSGESTDYPDFAVAVGRSVVGHPGSRGILLCRSGEGMEMAVNKVPGIRGALAWNEAVAAETRADNDANVLVLPADFLSADEAVRVARRFLVTDFSGEERHLRRIRKMHDIEGTTYEA